MARSIVAKTAARDPRVRLARVDELPAGWLGKVHAMSVGAASATGEWILFSDADVYIDRGVLERVVANAEANAIDFVAIMARMDRVSSVLDASIGFMLRLGVAGLRVDLANDDRSSVGRRKSNWTRFKTG